MICSELFNKIDMSSDRYLDFLEDVCNIESPTDFKEGVDKVGRYFIKRAEEKGWKTEVFPQPVSGDVVVITMNPDAEGQPISLSGHIDTVHPVGLFSAPAVHRDEEKMYGPGVLDCKGGAVAGFMAMEALESVGFNSLPVMLLLQTDEEKGSMPSNKSTIGYICERSKNSLAFVNLEGHSNGTACMTTKGIQRYKFTVTGKAAHSSRCYQGASAILEAAYKIQELEKYKDPETITCNCGVIEGGTVPNTVAEVCTFYADFRHRTNEEILEIEQTVKKVADSVTVEGCTCVAQRVSYRVAMTYEERNVKLLDTVNRIYSENGLPVLPERHGLGGSDAADVTAYGIPCIEGLGTQGGGVHSVTEFIYLNSLAQSAKRVAAIVYCI